MKLYNGTIEVKFNEKNHRYTIDGTPRIGVTTVLGQVLAKPALMMWPLDEAMKLLFGQSFEEVRGDDGEIAIKPIYNPKKALLKADKSYTLAELQDALEQARKAHTQKRDKGADTGSVVHAAIEAYLRGQKVVVMESSEAKKAIKGFINWFEAQKNIKVLAVERVVYSQAFDYCGTIDAVLEIDGRIVLVDWKTSNPSRTAPKGIYPENFIQLGAYAGAYQEEFGEDSVDDLMVVNVGKDGKVNTQLASGIKQGFFSLTPIECINLFTYCLNIYRAKNKITKGMK